MLSVNFVPVGFTDVLSRSQGMVDGAKAAEASNVAVAAAMGTQRGGIVGIELGFYRGLASAWAAKGHMYVGQRLYYARGD